jgi:hypothetical protein
LKFYEYFLVVILQTFIKNSFALVAMNTERLKSMGRQTSKWIGLGALVGLQTPIHETVHCGTAAITGGSCEQVELSARHWYMKPLEIITNGFYRVTELPSGIDGQAWTRHSESLFGRMSSILTAAGPEFAYTTLGIGLISLGVEKCKGNWKWGVAQVAAGGIFMRNTLNYMAISIAGARPGHDYYNVTEDILDFFHLPTSAATALTPYVAIPAMFAAAYFAAGALKNKLMGR